MENDGKHAVHVLCRVTVEQCPRVSGKALITKKSTLSAGGGRGSRGPVRRGPVTTSPTSSGVEGLREELALTAYTPHTRYLRGPKTSSVSVEEDPYLPVLSTESEGSTGPLG